MKPRYLVFARRDGLETGGAHDHIETYDDSFEALSEMVLHPGWSHVAELNGATLTIVAERDGDDLKLYPERMAHQCQESP